MTNVNYVAKPGEIRISSHDPRHHQDFLLLSSSINAWKSHVHDRSWWLTQENQCLGIFQRHGYDLQTGVWFCLISCQRHGWAGMANATRLLADGFSKTQRQCWPPIAANDLRQQIIEWYCTHAATCVYGLPLSSVEIETLKRLEDSVSIMLEQALSLQSRSQAALHNLLDYLQSSRQWQQKRALVAKATLTELPASVAATPAWEPVPILQLRARPWKEWFSGGAIGLVLTICFVTGANWLKQPSTLLLLNRIWPDNALSTRWKNRLIEQSASLPTINSWALVNQQLNTLEQRLLDAEQKRKPYMTISELKTEIYQMRQTLQQGEEPVMAQLDDLQRKLDNRQPVSDVEINVISQHLEALNSRFVQLTSQQK